MTTYNLEPGDPGEFLNDVEQVENEQDPREPKATHGHGIEPSSPAVTAVGRHRYTYKPEEIQYLKEEPIIIRET